MTLLSGSDSGCDSRGNTAYRYPAGPAEIAASSGRALLCHASCRLVPRPVLLRPPPQRLAAVERRGEATAWNLPAPIRQRAIVKCRGWRL